MKKESKLGQCMLSDLFPRFLVLLQNNKVKHRQVTDYASELYVSPKEYTLSDIDYHLRSTEYLVKEIANILGFPNPSFFGKYIKEYLGMSPMEYRNKRDRQEK